MRTTAPPAIVITGVTSFRNRGVEALVTCTIREIRDRLPGVSFTVLDRGTEFDRARLPAADVEFLPDGTLHHLHSGRIRRGATAVFPLLDKPALRARRRIARATAVVATGGDIFCSEYGHLSLLGHLGPLRLARGHGVPFYLHAQSIGPFTNEADRDVFQKTVRHAAGISVRERVSYNYLTEELKFPPESILHAADPAFLLAPADPAEGDRLFSHLRGREDRPTVALSVSQAICQWIQADADRHRETWLEVIAWLRRELDANIILIPHVQEAYDGNNDNLVATALLRGCGWDPRVRLAGGDLSAAGFKAILSRCDLVIAERMHASIAALSSGVPVLTIGYSVKAEGILSDLLGGEITRSQALISIRDFLVPGAATTRVQETWRSRHALTALLRTALPQAVRRAAAAFDLFSKLPARA